MKKSTVLLVGAGPGSKDLITVKGLKAIKKADIIFFDALVNKELLSYAKLHTKLIFVGKRHGKKYHTQKEINAMLAEAALHYSVVVRLKGGDPFVFGRGAEELRHLENQGIKTEVIPGVSSAIAVPTHHGIPLTSRGINESFYVITGTTRNGKISKDLQYGAMSSATLVILMGLRNIDIIMKDILKYRDSSTPFALIQNGTTKNEQISMDTIKNYRKVAKTIDYKLPGLIIVGNTVAEHPAFFEEEIQRVLQSTSLNA